MFFKSLVVLVAAATVGVAQQGVVSPTGYENRWAATVADIGIRNIGQNNTRQLQIHTDVPALVISEVAWRPWPLFWRIGTGALPVACDLYLGEGDYANRSVFFLSNFAGAPTRVVAGRTVYWPPWPPAVLPNPQDAFVLRLPLDAPWTYTRTRDLVWMTDVTSDTYYSADTAWRPRENLYAGISHGTGCYNTWNNQLAVITAEAGASRLALQHRFSFSCSGLRPNSPTTMLLGAGAVARSYPFLCGFQYVDGVFLGLLQVANTTGVIPRQDFTLPYEAGIVGLRLHGQAFCLDDGRHPLLLPVTMTNGIEVALPAVQPPWQPGCVIEGSRNATWSPGVQSDKIIVTRFR